jgi:hypothetical protein
VTAERERLAALEAVAEAAEAMQLSTDRAAVPIQVRVDRLGWARLLAALSALREQDMKQLHELERPFMTDEISGEEFIEARWHVLDTSASGCAGRPRWERDVSPLAQLRAVLEAGTSPTGEIESWEAIDTLEAIWVHLLAVAEAAELSGACDCAHPARWADGAGRCDVCTALTDLETAIAETMESGHGSD